MFLVHFQGEWHSGIARYTQNQKVCGSKVTDALRQALGTNLITRLSWPLARTWKIVVINIGWERLPPCRWSKVGLRVAKWPIKQIWSNITFCFSAFIVVFVSVGRHHIYFIKLANFFFGKQQGTVRTDQKIYSFLIYDFSMVLRIFKVATSLSIFLITRPLLAQQRKQMKSNYKFW